MGKFLPYMTKDYSIGLFNDDVNDIYHSAFGALTEAYEKFINPISSTFFDKEAINLLDICYGIGYNTKAFLQKVYSTNNSIKKINIDCVDTDNELIEISPFIKTKINFIDRLIHKNQLFKNIQNYNEAKKILTNNSNIRNKYKIDEFINIILLKNLIEKLEDRNLSKEAKNILSKNENRTFFNKNMLFLYEFLSKNEVQLVQKDFLSTFVHNIYYKYVSKQYKLCNKLSDKVEFNINFYPIDIRQHLKTSQHKYDIVLLDGFTPAKCPCIWSVDFLKKLSTLLNNDSVIITYNTSAPVRNAMKQAGLNIGNTIDSNNRFIGTVASNNMLLIEHPLSEAQEGLLNTKAGIPYRDNDLSLENEAIISNRTLEIENSNLISSSQYYKHQKEGTK